MTDGGVPTTRRHGRSVVHRDATTLEDLEDLRTHVSRSSYGPFLIMEAPGKVLHVLQTRSAVPAGCTDRSTRTTCGAGVPRQHVDARHVIQGPS